MSNQNPEEQENITEESETEAPAAAAATEQQGISDSDGDEDDEFAPVVLHGKLRKHRRQQFVPGRPGHPSKLLVFPDIFTKMAKKAVFCSLVASGTFEHPVRPPAGNDEQSRNKRKAEDAILEERQRKMHKEYPNWNKPAMRAIGDCARVSGHEAPASFVDKLRGYKRKPKHNRAHGPIITEYSHWEAYEQRLDKNFKGGLSAFRKQVEEVMWQSYREASGSFHETRNYRAEKRAEAKLKKHTNGPSAKPPPGSKATPAVAPAPVSAPTAAPPPLAKDPSSGTNTATLSPAASPVTAAANPETATEDKTETTTDNAEDRTMAASGNGGPLTDPFHGGTGDMRGMDGINGTGGNSIDGTGGSTGIDGTGGTGGSTGIDGTGGTGGSGSGSSSTSRSASPGTFWDRVKKSYGLTPDEYKTFSNLATERNRSVEEIIWPLVMEQYGLTPAEFRVAKFEAAHLGVTFSQYFDEMYGDKKKGTNHPKFGPGA